MEKSNEKSNVAINKEKKTGILMCLVLLLSWLFSYRKWMLPEKNSTFQDFCINRFENNKCQTCQENCSHTREIHRLRMKSLDNYVKMNEEGINESECWGGTFLLEIKRENSSETTRELQKF